MPLGKQAYLDSIVNTTSYNIKTRIFLKDETVNPGYGYSAFRNSKNDFEITTYISATNIQNIKADNQLNVFIRFAALKLPDLTNYTVAMKAAMVSTVWVTDKQIQLIEQCNINFYKPETLTATLYVDSI